jgi:hypothetical protein
VVLITTEAKRKTRERRGIVIEILRLPFTLVGLVWRALFGRKQTYYKKEHYHCNYCNHDFGGNYYEKQEEKAEKRARKGK